MICDVWKNRLTFIFLLIFTSTVTSQNVTTITISLNQTIINGNNELFGDFYTVNKSSSLFFNIKDVNKKVAFIIFQSHSHLYNITLYNNTMKYGSFITGRNLGLYSPVKTTMDSFYIVNDNLMNIKVYVSIHGYNINDPIPGGANLEFPIQVSPFMYSKYNDHYINIDAQKADFPSTAKNKSKPDVKMTYYRLYLPEFNFDEETYFDGIRKMISKEKILQYGIEIPDTVNAKPMRRMMSAYPGTASVYVVICSITADDKRYAVYVPTSTYACSPEIEDDCKLLNDATSEILCASLMFIGLFTCFFGHRFFKTEMFLAGCFSGIILTYIVIAMFNELEAPALIGVSVLSGIFFGGIWILFWWFYGIPVAAVLLPTLLFGFHCSSIIYYRAPPHELVREDGTFWPLFIFIMSATSILLLTITYISNLFCCAFLGAFATVLPLDYYMGSNLKYILINTVRRAVVPKFNYVVLAPPFQWRDLLAALLWVMLSVGGFLFQHYENRNRSPFPPPPRNITPRMPGSPLPGLYRNQRYGGIESGNDSTLPRSRTPVVIDERTPLI